MSEAEDFVIRDVVTERYHEQWQTSQDHARQAFVEQRSEIHKEILNSLFARKNITLLELPGGGFSYAGLNRADAFDILTGALDIVTERIRATLSHLTRDVWIILGRRHLICELLEPRGTPSPIHQNQTEGRVGSAIALFAKEGNSMLPDQPGQYVMTVNENIVTTIYVVRELCKLYDEFSINRRRLLMGGALETRPTEFLWVSLPPSLERRTKMVVSDKGVSILARAGFLLHSLTESSGNESEAPVERSFWFAAPVQRQNWENKEPSEVRPFGVGHFDGADLLPPLRLFERELFEQWRMSPIEIVACFVVLSQFVPKGVDKENRVVMMHTFESRATFSTEESSIRESLRDSLPEVCQSLGRSLPIGRLEPLVELGFRLLAGDVKDPNEDLVGLRWAQTWQPAIHRAGNKLLIDYTSLPRAISSLINCVILRPDRASMKGSAFEGQVREQILKEVANLDPVPALEQEFRNNVSLIGEADVVVRLGDTVFLIECKSRRTRGIDHCETLAEAERQLKDMSVWAKQVRRTAEYVSAHPTGPNHQVPSDVKWIIPVVCTALPEMLWQEDSALFLVPDEIPIVMTTDGIIDFLKSDRWKDRIGLTQYEVDHPETMVERARRLWNMREYEAALGSYRAAAVKYSQDPSVLVECGLRLVAAGNPIEAIKFYRTALAVDRAPATFNNLGIAYYEAGEYRQALKAYDQAMQIEDATSNLLVHMANSFDALGESDRALDLYRKAKDLDPRNPSAAYNLGVALLGLSKHTEAIEAFQKAIELDPDYLGAFNNIGAIHLQLGHPEKAIPYFEAVLRQKPDMVNSMRGLISSLMETGQEAEAAVLIGAYEALEGDMDAAMGAWATAIAEAQNPLAAFYLGDTLVKQENLEDGIPLLQFAAEAMPEKTEVRLRLAVALNSGGLFEEAAAELRKLLKPEPVSPHDRLALAREFSNTGSAYSVRGFFEEALFFLKTAIRLSPEYDIGHYNLAQAYFRSGDYDNAEHHYREAARLNPSHAHALSNLSSMLSRVHRSDEAMDVALRALRIDPNDAVALSTLAELYTEHGWWQQAEGMWRRAVTATEEGFGPEHPITAVRLRQLADMLKRTGRNEESAQLEARASWIEANSPSDMKPTGNFESLQL